MSVSLEKGQRVNLSKEDGSALRRVMAGLGWDKITNQGSHNIDCDASALLCGRNGKITCREDVVYFGNLKHPSNAVQHTGDNLTGIGEGDDEQVILTLSDIPTQYEKIVFVVTIYQAKERRQHFGMIRNAFIRIVDIEARKEMLRYNLSENYDGMTAMFFGEIYRKDGLWKFNALGQGTQDAGLSALIGRYS
ncbi:MAG: TerD family protein [Treponema sp.]|jgi:stress response protein SCP2|nr:TerD family protein [Treponema sp.]